MAGKLNVKNLKLKDELGNFLALIKQQLELLTEKAVEGSGEFDPSIVQGMVNLTKCFEAATRSKIAIDRADKKKEDNLTPEEELEEVKIYLMDFEHRERLDIVHDIIVRHNKKCMVAKKPFLVKEVDGGI